VLIAVGTSTEHLESEWVRYEWDGFFNDIISGVKPDGRVFSYVEGVEVKALPRALRQSQAITHRDGSLELLYRFVANALEVDAIAPEVVAPTATPGESCPRRSLVPDSSIRQRLKVYLVGATYGGPYDTRSEVFAAIKMEMGNDRELALQCLDALIAEHPIDTGRPIDHVGANAALMSVRVHPCPSPEVIRYALAVMQLSDSYSVRARLVQDLGEVYARVCKTWSAEFQREVYRTISEVTTDDVHQYVRKTATESLPRMPKPG
jgi:hypothetical protein